MNVLSGVVLFALVMALLPLSIRLAIAAARRGALRGICIMLSLMLVPGVLLLAALWVSHQGQPEEGVVVGKAERLEISDSGLAPAVAHRLTLLVASGAMKVPTGAQNHRARIFERVRPRPADLEFDVDERMYDEVREYSPVHFHAVYFGPLVFARLDAEPWWNLAPGWLERLLPARYSGPVVSADAKVTSVRTVSDAYEFSLLASSGEGGARTVLKQSYQEVRLAFSTPNGAEILALDRIDAGSAGLVEPAMTVAVRYPKDRPRQAQLQQGTRRFARTNALQYWRADIVGFVAAVAFTASFYRVWKRWRRRAEIARARRASSTQRAAAR